MTEAGHRLALEELRAARGRLIRDVDIRAYVELSFGIAFQLVCVGAQWRHGLHRENHEGLGRWLRERGHVEVADQNKCASRGGAGAVPDRAVVWPAG